jgi:DNA-binding response OmpR family regulator
VFDGSETAAVLVVDDEEQVADVYALRLRGEYETRTAYGGAAALEAYDGDVDVVLLDRRMPDVAGDEVLAELRERDADVRVVMLTAVDPDFDILSMPFDDYLCKPVEKDDLLAAIEQQVEARRYDEQLDEYLQVTSKLSLLQAEKTPQELEGNDEVQGLSDRAAELKAEMDEMLGGVEDIERAFMEIERGPS